MKTIDLIAIDDNNTFLQGLGSFLSEVSGVNLIKTFNSGIESIKSLNRFHCNIILVDIEMPQLDGFETAKRINIIEPEIKLVAVTMYQDKVYLRKLIESGFKGYISKSKVPENLIPTLKKVHNNQLAFPKEIIL